MKPDLLICWIKHCDYPIFRSFLRRHRDSFGKIIIYWSEHFREYYFDKFIQKDLESLGNVEFVMNVDYKYGVEDWRNVATNIMLKRTNSEWVCSVEQDWFAKDWDKLLTKVSDAMKMDSDLIGWWQENNKYIHPSFWFIRRFILDNTRRDFAAHDGHDHFGWITEDVKTIGGKIVSTQDMGFKDFEDCFHLGGVNQNYLEGLKPGYVFHRPELFYIYNWWSMKADVPQDPKFVELMKKIDNKLKLQIPDVNPETDSRAIFFK